MEKLIKKIINFYSFKIISDKIRNNIKSIIYSAVALVLIIIVYQFYIYQNNKLSCRPCTKIGLSRCPLKHFNCMNQIKFEDVIL